MYDEYIQLAFWHFFLRQIRIPVWPTRPWKSGLQPDVLPKSSVADPWHFGADSDPRIRTSDWCIQIRIRLRFLRLHLHHFSMIKMHKKSQNSRNQGFSYYFCLMIGRSGAESVPRTNGSGSVMPKIVLHVSWLKNSTGSKAQEGLLTDSLKFIFTDAMRVLYVRCWESYAHLVIKWLKWV